MTLERIQAPRELDRVQLENVARALGMGGGLLRWPSMDSLRLACIDAICDEELREQRIDQAEGGADARA